MAPTSPGALLEITRLVRKPKEISDERAPEMTGCTMPRKLLAT
jgi:hypothetical protein